MRWDGRAHLSRVACVLWVWGKVRAHMGRDTTRRFFFAGWVKKNSGREIEPGEGEREEGGEAAAGTESLGLGASGRG